MDIGIPLNVFIQIDKSDLSTNEDTPFCLMNILNKPILFYLLEFFERNNFKEVNLVTLPKFSFQINTVIQSYIGNIKPIVLTTKDETTFEDLNIFDFIHKKVTKHNFILMKSNCLLDFDLSRLLDYHFLNNNFLSMCLSKTDFVSQDSRPKLSLYGKEAQLFPNVIHEVFGLENTENKNIKKLVYASTISDNPDLDSFCLTTELLDKHNDFDLDYTYHDIEFYVFNKKIFKLLELSRVKGLNDVKTQLIPLLINKSSHNYFKKALKEDDQLENDNSLRIYANLFESECYKLDTPLKIIGVLYETQKNIKDIQKVFFPTENNQENILNEYRNIIYSNIANNKNPLHDLPNEIKMISMDSLVSKPINFAGNRCKITKSIIGSGIKINDGSKVQLSIILNNCSIDVE